jgi:hypothetical protein
LSGFILHIRDDLSNSLLALFSKKQSAATRSDAAADCQRLISLRIIQYYLRLSFAHFKLGAHFLDLRGLLFQGGSKDFDFLLLFRGSRLLL